jgi:hypothetical protein
MEPDKPIVADEHAGIGEPTPAKMSRYVIVASGWPGLAVLGQRDIERTGDLNLVECFAVGGQWENAAWEIVHNAIVSMWSGGSPCPHCGKPFTQFGHHTNGKRFDSQHWICPRVVVAYNEGGFSSTGVCLDCILEAAHALGAA